MLYVKTYSWKDILEIGGSRKKLFFFFFFELYDSLVMEDKIIDFKIIY